MKSIVSTDDSKKILFIGKDVQIPYDDIKRIKIRATQWRRFLIVERHSGKPLSFPVPDDAEETAEKLDVVLRKNDDYRIYNEEQDKKHERAVSLCVTALILFVPVAFAVLLLLPPVAGWIIFSVLSVVLIGLLVSTALT